MEKSASDLFADLFFWKTNRFVLRHVDPIKNYLVKQNVVGQMIFFSQVLHAHNTSLQPLWFSHNVINLPSIEPNIVSGAHWPRTAAIKPSKQVFTACPAIYWLNINNFRTYHNVHVRVNI